MMVKINSQNNELFRFVVIISLVLLMILFITRAYLSNKPAVDAVEFSMRKHNFSQTVSLIRGQWLLEGRPSSVDYSFYNNQGNVVKTTNFLVSKSGWPSVGLSTNKDYCDVLWRTIINLEPENVKNVTIVAIQSKKSDDIVCQICDANEHVTCFDYSAKFGIQYP